jgi:hypothetical protein
MEVIFVENYRRNGDNNVMFIHIINNIKVPNICTNLLNVLRRSVNYRFVI